MVDKIKFFVFRLTIDPQLLLSSNFSMSIVPYYQLFVIMGNFKILLKASIWTTLVVGVLENPDETLTFSFERCGIRNPKSGILGFGIHAPQRIRILQTIGIPNPSSTDKKSRIQYLESGIHRVESGIPGFEIHAAQRIRILQTIGIPNPSSTDKKSRIQYLESGIHRVESGILGFEIHASQRIRILQTIGNPNPSSTDKESRIQYLESGIHGVESRIQDCLGIPYMRG